MPPQRRQPRYSARSESFNKVSTYLHSQNLKNRILPIPAGFSRTAVKYDAGAQYQGPKPSFIRGANRRLSDVPGDRTYRRYSDNDDSSKIINLSDTEIEPLEEEEQAITTPNSVTITTKKADHRDHRCVLEENLHNTEDDTASMHDEDDGSVYMGSDKESDDSTTRKRALEYDTDTSSVARRTGRRYGTIALSLCPQCLKSCRNVREQLHSPTMCKSISPRLDGS